MGLDDLAKLEPRDLQLVIAQKVEQMHDVDLPEIKERLKSGDTKLDNHEGRLIKIETTKRVENRLLGSNGKAKILGGGGAISLLLAMIYGIGTTAGWW